MRERHPHTDPSVSADTASPAASLADQVRTQLERIVGSEQFRGSLRLKRFLSFIVETTLAGESESIKAYTIAIEALDRGDNFDPQTDPIVRVEAGRLRQALTRYYGEAGRDDPVAIDLPRGTYVPRFHPRAIKRAIRQIDPPIRSDSNTRVAALALVESGAAQPSRPDVPQLFNAPQQFRRAASEYHILVANHHLQMADVTNVVRSLQHTLSQSFELRVALAKLGSARLRTAELPAPSAGRDAWPARAETPGEVRGRHWSDPSEPPTRKNTRGAAARIGGAVVHAIGRARPHTRFIKIAFTAITVLAILEALFDLDRPLTGGPNHGLVQRYWLASHATASQPKKGETAPEIYVAPVVAVSKPVGDALSPDVVRGRLIDALARYDNVAVLNDAPLPRAAAPGSAPESGATNSSIYRLVTTLHYYADGSAIAIEELTDTTDGTIAWSKTYQWPGKSEVNHRGVIAPDIARLLLGPFGVIQARERIKLASVSPMQNTYRCILDANFYLRSFDPSQYQPVHDCLLHASAETPAEVTVFADLAFVYLRNYRLGIASRPGDRTMLDDAYASAARAVEIKPNSAFAQYALQEVLLARGDIARATIAGDNAFRLNPSDSAVAFGHAELLILTGQIDAGLALLKENAAKTPNGWVGYHILMALGCYLKGDFGTAGVESKQIANPFFPPGLVLDALVADKVGDAARAQQDIATLSQFYPAWRANFDASVARFLPNPAMAQRIAADFEAAANGVGQ